MKFFTKCQKLNCKRIPTYDSPTSEGAPKYCDIHKGRYSKLAKYDVAGYFSRWVCWHPDLGYLTFGSYRKAQAHPSPNPRGLFFSKKEAESRMTRSFWYRGKKYSGSEIKVLEVEFDWALKEEQ